ncbi:hypothetical protein B0H19DRAFT_689384 [Mycena capillaripes]|nr:hypothetical protein B0H19DRAFT_689384 [Mycena capillaripes]
MRRRTIQYLVLLFVSAVLTHLYFLSPSHSASHLSEWNNSEEVQHPEAERKILADIHKLDAVVAAFQVRERTTRNKFGTHFVWASSHISQSRNVD